MISGSRFAFGIAREDFDPHKKKLSGRLARHESELPILNLGRYKSYDGT